MRNPIYYLSVCFLDLTAVTIFNVISCFCEQQISIVLTIQRPVRWENSREVLYLPSKSEAGGSSIRPPQLRHFRFLSYSVM